MQCVYDFAHLWWFSWMGPLYREHKAAYKDANQSENKSGINLHLFSLKLHLRPIPLWQQMHITFYNYASLHRFS